MHHAHLRAPQSVGLHQVCIAGYLREVEHLLRPWQGLRYAPLRQDGAEQSRKNRCQHVIALEIAAAGKASLVAFSSCRQTRSHPSRLGNRRLTLLMLNVADFTAHPEPSLIAPGSKPLIPCPPSACFSATDVFGQKSSKKAESLPWQPNQPPKQRQSPRPRLQPKRQKNLR